MQELEILYELVGNTENILYQICNTRNSVPRQGIEEYSSPKSKKFEQEIKNQRFRNIHKSKNKHAFVTQAGEIQQDKYAGMNIGIDSLYNTIEFRFPNGTLDANQWVENINLFAGIMQTSKRIGHILSKRDIDLTDEEKSIIKDYRTLKSGGISQKQKLKILLKLCIPKNKHYIYIEKYNANHKKILMQKYYKTKRLIDSGTAYRVDFSENDYER